MARLADFVINKSYFSDDISTVCLVAFQDLWIYEELPRKCSCISVPCLRASISGLTQQSRFSCNWQQELSTLLANNFSLAFITVAQLYDCLASYSSIVSDLHLNHKLGSCSVYFCCRTSVHQMWQINDIAFFLGVKLFHVKMFCYVHMFFFSRLQVNFICDFIAIVVS